MHAVLERQLAALASGDIEAVMENYAPDAALIRFDRTSAGAEAIRATLSAYVTVKPTMVSLVQYAEHDDTVFYRAVMNVEGQEKSTMGTFVLREGKIWRQTAGFFGE
ncbi:MULTISPECIES: nuclear transport factor 2 family protein [unclassified Streptomyces]|uniref:nuclear transport factor 2 family protein n=1 Tax=unclassified Streptomyces TaxID=2593676 RepID=UPI00366087EC